MKVKGGGSIFLAGDWWFPVSARRRRPTPAGLVGHVACRSAGFRAVFAQHAALAGLAVVDVRR